MTPEEDFSAFRARYLRTPSIREYVEARPPTPYATVRGQARVIPWKPIDNDRLLDGFLAGKMATEIAIDIGRTAEAVQHRGNLLGLIFGNKGHGRSVKPGSRAERLLEARQAVLAGTVPGDLATGPEILDATAQRGTSNA